MKQTKHIARKQWALLGSWLPLLMLTGSLLISCSQDNAGDGTPLANGKYPLQLSAMAPQSPATAGGGKDTWKGGEEIGIMLDGMLNPKTYIMDATGNATPKNADNTIFWQNNAETRVTAWTPNLFEPYLDISDQRNGYADFDIMYASAMGRYDRAIQLHFNHRMAKVEVTLKAGEGITAEEAERATITIFGDSEAYVSGGMVGAADHSDGEIKPYYNANTKTYEAVVVPQNMTNRPLVQIAIDGNFLTYTPDTEAAGNLQAGKRYAYTVTVKAPGEIDVTQTMAGNAWGYGGEENVATVKTIVYSADEVKAGDYIYSDGTTSDGGLRKRYEDGRAPVVASPKPKPIAGKQVVGVVFWTPKDTDPTGRQTPARLTDDKIMMKDFPNCTHGLAVSLLHENLELFQNKPENIAVNFQGEEFFNPADKADYTTIQSLTGYGWHINHILGYQNTKVMLAYNEYCKKNKKTNNIVIPVDQLQEWNKLCPAPQNSTGWFIPSPKELHILCYKDVDDIYQKRNFSYSKAENWNYIVNPSLAEAGSKALIYSSVYWSSTEVYYSRNEVFGMRFPDASLENKDRSTYKVRFLVVCAF